jgi:anthranilate phosphoribosyltransferase
MNLLGPLLNPANIAQQLLGVYKANLLKPMAQASQRLGRERVMAVYGHDGLDEISVCAPTTIVETGRGDDAVEYVFHPDKVGITGCSSNDLTGGTPEDNADTALELLAGGGNKTLVASVALNAGAALFVAGKVESIMEGYEAARRALKSGQAAEKLEEIRHAAVELKEQHAEAAAT